MCSPSTRISPGVTMRPASTSTSRAACRINTRGGWAKSDVALRMIKRTNLISQLNRKKPWGENGRMALRFTNSYIEDSLSLFRYYKELAERAMVQISDEHLLSAPDAESNSVAVIVKHMAGNMQSRWPDFLTTDGEKPGRDRDAEFENPPATRGEMMASWERGWQCLFDAIEPLTDGDLSRRVTI